MAGRRRRECGWLRADNAMLGLLFELMNNRKENEESENEIKGKEKKKLGCRR